MKAIISLIFCLVLCPEIILAQQVSLKHPLSKADYASLDKVVKECFSYEPTFGFTFQLDDFFDFKDLVPDKISSLKQIREMEKDVRGNYKDVAVYNKIGMAYQGLFMTNEAHENFKKALDLATVFAGNNPDSSSAFMALGISHMNLGNLIEAGMAFQRSYEMNENDSIAKTMLMTCFLYSGNFDSALSLINEMISRKPCDLENYAFQFLMLYFRKFTELGKLPRDSLESSLKGKSAEEIIDFSGLETVCERNKKHKQFQILYQFSRHSALTLKSFFRTSADTSITYANFKFLVEEDDLIELNKLETFYKDCLDDQTIPLRFLLNKALGNICLLKGETESAIQYLEKAIEFKPLEKSQFRNNAEGEYDDLAFVYFILKDTASYEKVVKRKFRIKPAIIPLSEDFVSMAKLSVFHNNYSKARKYCEEAVRIDPDLFNAYLGLAVLDIIGRDTRSAGDKLNTMFRIDRDRGNLYLLQGICMLFDNDISTAYTSFQIARRHMDDPTWITREIINKYFVVKAE